MYAVLLGLLVQISTTMGVVLIGMTPINFILVLWEGRFVSVAVEKLKTHEREFTEFAEENLSLGAVRRTLGMQHRALEEANERAKHTLKWAERYDKSTSIITMHLAWLDILYKAFMLGYGASEIMAGHLSVGVWFTYWSAATSVTPLIPVMANVRRLTLRAGSTPSCPALRSRRPLEEWRRQSADFRGGLALPPQSITQYHGVQSALALLLSIQVSCFVELDTERSPPSSLLLRSSAE